MPGTGDPLQRALARRAAQLRGEDPAPSGATRREVLAGGVALGAGIVLPSRREQRAQLRQQRRTGARVVVVGAGLAGLTRAYRLRRHGVGVDVFEARHDRVGGRCWTARGFENSQVAEHGGEFIDTRHVHIRRLARELGQELEDRAAAEHKDSVEPLWLNGSLRSSDAVYKGFDALFRRLKRDYRRIGDYRYNRASRAAREFDEMTARDWLDANVDQPLLHEAVAITLSGFFGLDARRLSAINLLESYVAPYAGADERYHVKFGNDYIPRQLAGKLNPGQLHMEAPLTALARRGDHYELRFGGVRKPVVADRVVLCLPFTTLRKVDLSSSGLSAKRRRSIRRLGMGTNSKNHFQLGVRPYELGKWSGGMAMDTPFPQSSWDSTEGQSGPTSVITVWRGGRAGASYPTDTPHQVAPPRIIRATLSAFERGVPGITAAYNGRSWLDSWVDDPWTHGSYAGFLPGQYTSYWGYLGRAEDGIHFAGEHTSTHSQGYLNGGVESGERAAREVLAAVK